MFVKAIKAFFLLGSVLLCFAPMSVGAEVVDEAEIDIRTREISKTLRCAVCQTESIWESNAELARQMRQVVRDRIAEGQSNQEILDYFHSRYGDYILLEPRKTGLNWVIWGGPFLLLGIGAVVLYRTVSRWVAQSPPSTEEIPPLDEESRQRIERELRSQNQ